jgi:hypothetical protein
MLCARILSAVGSGMMALTGIVFAIAFVMIQSGAVFQTLGIFFATFLAALNWTDRGGSGGAPLFSNCWSAFCPSSACWHSPGWCRVSAICNPQRYCEPLEREGGP